MKSNPAPTGAPVLPARIFDRHRPGFHYSPPANWMNDPNGLIQWNGRYHLFYQYNPFGSLWGNMHWGHAVSDDLVHWQDLPLALAPGDGDFDEAGCFSGCMVIDDDGTPTILYTGTQAQPDGRMPFSQHACVATGAHDLQTWQKFGGNPVIKPPAGLDLVGFRDHCVWREGDHWLQIIGSGIHGVGGAAFLYRSANLMEWEQLGPLLVLDGEYFDDVWFGTMWECPQLLLFDETAVLLISVSHDDKPQQTAYFVGRYENQTFIPESAHLVDLGRRHFYAPQAMVDENGRTLLWGWLCESRSNSLCVNAGWSGVMSLPRVLTMLPNGKLGMQPAPELQSLRGQHWQFGAEQQADVTQLRGDSLELRVKFAPQLGRVGLRLRCSDEEHTTIFYDRRRALLGIDRSQATCENRAEHNLDTLEGHFTLPANELLELHIFLDKSVIEVFVNGETAVSGRIYPSREDSLGLEIVAEAGEFISLDTWQLDTIW